MSIRIIETSISETHVRMRLADDRDREKSSESIDFVVEIGPRLTLPGGGDIPLGDHHTRQLASIQLAALRYVRDVIGGETQRLSSLART